MISLCAMFARLKRMVPGAAHGPPAAAMTAAAVPDTGLPLPFRITVCGIDELAAHRAARVSHVLSILDPDWPEPEVFGRFGEHEKLELRFHDVIEEDPRSVVPESGHIRQLLAFGARLDREPGAHLLVHCHAGVSRSSASMALLIAQAVPAQPGEAIFAEIMRIRPQIWPNLRIVELGDQALGRNGDLIAAAHRVYRLQLGKRPELAAAFRLGGRGREVEAALRVARPAPDGD
nr:protein-tyrosine-phosphatase [uncultured Rhodopila sp.]